jgi:hypothetical protein
MLTRIERQVLLSKSTIRWFVGITVIFTILILSIRIAQVTIGPELGKYGRLNRPIIETLEKLPVRLTNNSIIKTEDGFLGSHLLSHYQNHNVIIAEKNFIQQGSKNTVKCLWLWDDDDIYVEADINNTSHSGQLTTMVADKKYTLFYTLTPTQECN